MLEYFILLKISIEFSKNKVFYKLEINVHHSWLSSATPTVELHKNQFCMFIEVKFFNKCNEHLNKIKKSTCTVIIKNTNNCMIKSSFSIYGPSVSWKT